jgi:tRNA(Ile)-lysidine synthase TilS/MesJ
MAAALSERQAFFPMRYHLELGVIQPAHVRPPAGWDGALDQVSRARGLQVARRDLPFTPGAGERMGKTCARCAKARRAALIDLARERDCAAIATPHHQDDFAETFLSALLFRGEFAPMKARNDLSAAGVRMIRPMAAIEGRVARRFGRDHGVPDAPFDCPFADTEGRRRLKSALASLGGSAARLRANVLNAAARVTKDYLP